MYEKLEQVKELATRLHGDQKRKSIDIPYVIHPIRVALILKSVGFSEFEHDNLMIAAHCHDLIEDT